MGILCDSQDSLRLGKQKNVVRGVGAKMGEQRAENQVEGDLRRNHKQGKGRRRRIRSGFLDSTGS